MTPDAEVPDPAVLAVGAAGTDDGWASDYTSSPEAPGRVRHRLEAVLVGWGVGRDTVDDVLMVVSELVSNVVDHARTAFRVSVDVRGSLVHVAVHDRSPEQPQLRPFSVNAHRGRGLQLVAALSVRWGCDTSPDGKTVWADLAR